MRSFWKGESSGCRNTKGRTKALCFPSHISLLSLITHATPLTHSIKLADTLLDLLAGGGADCAHSRGGATAAWPHVITPPGRHPHGGDSRNDAWLSGRLGGHGAKDEGFARKESKCRDKRKQRRPIHRCHARVAGAGQAQGARDGGPHGKGAAVEVVDCVRWWCVSDKRFRVAITILLFSLSFSTHPNQASDQTGWSAGGTAGSSPGRLGRGKGKGERGSATRTGAQTHSATVFAPSLHTLPLSSLT